ncbi:type II secretion system secretin GspD [Schlegelella sp. ID0723]|uniref:Type II secretion system secretin GspD n=2 Tax=Piscinibacter koreensis TaxID=2742824 RepID=A0A7Y6TVZ4_9BURK|nr:type II secretion system secretin GspD [Schlegelella koreensis]NUZ05614.1 type II secretion system secretin GspD [Schlegelella koreensis]
MLPPPAAFAQPAAANRFRGEPVTLNFVNAEIEGVARAMSAILRQQFIVDPRVRGTITLFSEEPLSPRDAYYNFLAALRGLGFTVVEVGGLFKVVPEADAKLQAGTVSVGGVARRGDQVITQIFKLNYENANNLVPVLRPLISPNNTINANIGNNSLVITDYADNLQRIAKIVAAMDSPSTGDIEVMPLRYAIAADIAPLVQRLSGEGGGAATVPGLPPGATGGAVGGGVSIFVDPRSNSLIVRTTNTARMTIVRNLVERLDRPLEGAAATGNIWVVHLKNADATKLATVLRAAFAAGGSQSAGGGASGGLGGSGLPGNLGSAGGAVSGFAGGANTAVATSTAPGGTSGAASPVTPSAAPSTGGFVQADPATNSLIITAPEPLYRQVRMMIDQLDSRRTQVYIESMIVEVSGDNAADFGFQWQGLLGNGSDKYIGVGGTNFNVGGASGNNIIGLTGGVISGTVQGAAQAAAGIGEGLNIGLIRNYGGFYGLSAVARVLQSQTNTNIVSTPNLITLDNEEAKIIVGSNVPFVTGQFTNTGTGTTSPFQTIERKDVGITLRIKPQVGEDGTVRMTIFQESSSLSSQVAPGTSNAGPTTNKRSIESNVVVDDGQIIVLGGLIEDSYTSNQSKIPLLGDLPYVGGLFRSEDRSKRRTNLMVFLRPVVMRDAPSTNQLSLDRYQLIRQSQLDQQPKPNRMLPISESPVIPPLGSVEDTTNSLNPPQKPLENALPRARGNADATSAPVPARPLPEATPLPARPVPNATTLPPRIERN